MTRRGLLLICLFGLTSACASAEDDQGAFGPPARVDSATTPDTASPIDTSIAADSTTRADSTEDASDAIADTESHDSTLEPDTLADSSADTTSDDASDTDAGDATVGDVADTDAIDATDVYDASDDTFVADTASDSMDDTGTDADACTWPCPTPPYEVESNNTVATATPLWPSTTTWIAAIEPYGDLDYFTFTLTAPAMVEVMTHNVAAPTLCSHDTLIHLLDSTGAELWSDDDGGVGTCSWIKTTSPLPAGKYYILAHEFGDNATISGYQIDIVIK